MLRFVNKILCIVICITIMISCTACQTGASKTTITELNKIFKNSKMKITATDIKAVKNESGVSDELSGSKDIIIGVEFLVENISIEEFYFGTKSMPIQAYIGDFEAEQAISGTFGSVADLMGKIVPGKKLIGYYSAYAPKDTEKIEIHIRTEYLPDKYAVFILDVPSVDEE